MNVKELRALTALALHIPTLAFWEDAYVQHLDGAPVVLAIRQNPQKRYVRDPYGTLLHVTTHRVDVVRSWSDLVHILAEEEKRVCDAAHQEVTG